MRRLIITVLVLAAVLVAADFGAAALAESAVSRQMRGQLGLVDDPSVRINGFPFLTQAVSGEYPSIDVDATRIPYGTFKELEITAQLQGVVAPLPMLLGSGKKTIEVTRADGTVKIDAADLERLVPQATKVRIESVDKTTLQQAVKNGADASVGKLDPAYLKPAKQVLLDGYVRAEWGTSDNNRRARYYTLTAAGQKQLLAEQEEFDRVIGAINAVLRLA